MTRSGRAFLAEYRLLSRPEQGSAEVLAVPMPARITYISRALGPSFPERAEG
jgi:hypothetical protein